jgi:hypothetical protein
MIAVSIVRRKSLTPSVVAAVGDVFLSLLVTESQTHRKILFSIYVYSKEVGDAPD